MWTVAYPCGWIVDLSFFQFIFFHDKHNFYIWIKYFYILKMNSIRIVKPVWI